VATMLDWQYYCSSAGCELGLVSTQFAQLHIHYLPTSTLY
jgi:hypothetical protein